MVTLGSGIGTKTSEMTVDLIIPHSSTYTYMFIYDNTYEHKNTICCITTLCMCHRKFFMTCIISLSTDACSLYAIL